MTPHFKLALFATCLAIMALVLSGCGGGEPDENIKEPCVYIPALDSCGPTN